MPGRGKAHVGSVVDAHAPFERILGSVDLIVDHVQPVLHRPHRVAVDGMAAMRGFDLVVQPVDLVVQRLQRPGGVEVRLGAIRGDDGTVTASAVATASATRDSRSEIASSNPASSVGVAYVVPESEPPVEPVVSPDESVPDASSPDEEPALEEEPVEPERRSSISRCMVSRRSRISSVASSRSAHPPSDIARAAVRHNAAPMLRSVLLIPISVTENASGQADLTG